MRFLADMGVSRSVVASLRANGHDAVHLLDLGLERLADSDVFSLAAHEGRILLTFDLDFGEIVAIEKDRAVGVVLFRLQNARVTRVRDRLMTCLAEAAAALEDSAIVVVEDSRLRIRRRVERK